MFVNKIILASNPFVDAYIHSDFVGRLIFIGLAVLSIFSWTVLVHKTWTTHRAKKNSARFNLFFQRHSSSPLAVECSAIECRQNPNPFLDLYLGLKKNTVSLLNKNRLYGSEQQPEKTGEHTYLSPADIEFVDYNLQAEVVSQTKRLEKNLFILSTIVSLAPFLGLLGTVWGILTTFAELQTQAGGSTHQIVLGGLSLALATTVLGLVDAIPALIGYNYLKNSIQEFAVEMGSFSTEILAAVEMQYRKVE